MIRVLIVDDESAVRNGLLKYVHWDDLGIDSVCAKETVEEALDYIQEEMPEIIISDIRMPGMNGIELCNAIRKVHPLSRIIFLSGYSDKEYLMGAISLSADAYLEKPVGIPEMEESLQKVIAKCMKEQEKQKLEEDNQEKLQEQCVQELTKGRFDTEILQKLGGEVFFELSPNRYYRCIILQIAKDDNITAGQVREFLLRVRDIFREIQALLARKKENQIVILISFNEDELLRRQELDTRWLCEKLKEYSGRDMRLFGVFSERRKGFEEIVPLYVQACADLQKVFYLGYGKFYVGEDRKKTDYRKEKEEYSLMAFREAVLAKNRAEAENEAMKLFCFYQGETELLPNIVKDIFFRFTVEIYRESEKNAMLVSDENAFREKDFLWERINKLETLEECMQCLMENISLCMEKREHLSADYHLIAEVTDYVKQHFSDVNLSVKEIADSVYLTPPYLSHIFKNKTGKTLIQYIKEVRLEHSIILMGDGKFTLADIAEKCGYADPNYYAKVFKKAYGWNPSEYRERMKR
ncbi:MAG: response regulator [Lachnospiraceae bacterium]|nr:response regulator [Lachnospiraceae bacterium]